MITAPFNFVPVSEKVFFPDWAEKVSHDVPFEDGESGVIDITLTAKSPIFVRDHESEEAFCNYNGTHYIPGSSVKGMIRSILEIMSFSKMSLFNDDTYAVRDLSDSNNFYMKEMKKDTFCGWLRKEGKEYIVEDCGKAGRIKHEEIDKIFGIDFASQHKKGKFGNKASDKTALRKYSLIKSENFKYPFVHTTTSTVGDKRYRLDKNSSLFGTIVLTGQPSGRDEDRKIPSGKVYEFVFFERKSDIKLREEVVENFMFAYFDGRKTEPKESPDWKYWKEKLNKGEKVPVFFQKNGKEVMHFGLSYLYKLPYTHSVKDGLPPRHSDSRKDLAQTMFGYIGKDEALKGRVQFSHFKADKAVELEKRTEILGTPRASYYPMYVKQEEGKLFSTFMNGDFSISGWKRYPVHSGSKVSKTTDTGNENVGTTFSPLKEGVVFEGKVRYHNLKKAELGALLSALSFHNTNDCFHNIGLAKALGYGKVELKLNGIENIEEYLKAFEVEVSEQVEGWSHSEQIKELLTMSTEQNNSGNSKLKYMDLPQFAKNKTGDNKDYLRNYTQLEGITTVTAKSLITEEDLEALRVKQLERKEKECLQEEQKKREELHTSEWHIVHESTTIATIETFVTKYPETPYLKTANEMIAALKEKAESADKEEKEKAAQDKWDAIQKVEDRYRQKALEDFIKNYSYSPLVEDAKRELETFTKSSNADNKAKTLSLDGIDNEDDLCRYMKSNRNILDDNIDKIKKIADQIFSKLESKKQKSNLVKKIDKNAYKNFSKNLDLT